MSNNFEETWEIYTSSWRAATEDSKRSIFEQCLIAECTYVDPIVATKGWDDLVIYMLNFHLQIPGGHFVTNNFMAHHNQSIAVWDMKNGEGVVMGDGISYGRYDENGKLLAMTGFFKAP